MNTNKRSPEAWTPSRTPGHNDFARPTFQLGRISLGSSFTSSDEGSSKRSSSSTPPHVGSCAKQDQPLRAAGAGSYNLLVDGTPRYSERRGRCCDRAEPPSSHHRPPSSPFGSAGHGEPRGLAAGDSISPPVKAGGYLFGSPQEHSRRSTIKSSGARPGTADCQGDYSLGAAVSSAGEHDRENVSPAMCAGSVSGSPFPRPEPISSEPYCSARRFGLLESGGGHEYRKRSPPTAAVGHVPGGSSVGTPASSGRSGPSPRASPAERDAVDLTTSSSPSSFSISPVPPQRARQDAVIIEGRGIGSNSRNRAGLCDGSPYSNGGGGDSDECTIISAGDNGSKGSNAWTPSSGAVAKASAAPAASFSEGTPSTMGSGQESRMGFGGREDDQTRPAPGKWEEEADGLRWKMEAQRIDRRDSPPSPGGASESTKKPRAFSVPAELYDRMYGHQREGVRWLWGLHQGDMGGILGDDMGMGKTYQVTCFLAGLFSTDQAKCALVLAPKSVMRGWETELRKWLVEAACPTVEVVVLTHEVSPVKRKRVIGRAIKGGYMGGGAVVVTSYGLVSARREHFAPLGKDHKWDYVILDEGHKIKNCSTRTCKAVHDVPARRRLALTGTPIQNNMRELHTVVDWVTFGRLFGTYDRFKKTFSGPMESGQDKNASEKTVLRSRARAAELRQLLDPYLLQRLKDIVMDQSKVAKTEMVVWVALSKKQRRNYMAYLGGTSVKDVLEGKTSSPLEAIQALKKITLHPLVSSYPLEQAWCLDSKHTVTELVRDSSKLSVVLDIVADACENTHRVLIFSRSVRMLDILERCIGRPKAVGGLGLEMTRIDGSHTDLERQSAIAKFNGDDSISVCLVSTGAGGTGITLTGADRVILFDPSWNPAEDMQAVDRAYRIGQTRDVVVYRMIAAGTVEEKMYEKQVFKDGLRKTIMGSGSGKRHKKNVRYFSRAELRELFTLFPPGKCRVLEQLESMHGSLAQRLEAAKSPAQQKLSLEGHLNFVCDLVGSYGASAHGDGLPKIIAPGGTANAILLGEGSGGGRAGLWQSRCMIAEDEDESDLEILEDDSDGGRAPGEGVYQFESYGDSNKTAPRPRSRACAGKSRRFTGGDVNNGAAVEVDSDESDSDFAIEVPPVGSAAYAGSAGKSPRFTGGDVNNGAAVEVDADESDSDFAIELVPPQLEAVADVGVDDGEDGDHEGLGDEAGLPSSRGCDESEEGSDGDESKGSGIGRYDGGKTGGDVDLVGGGFSRRDIGIDGCHLVGLGGDDDAEGKDDGGSKVTTDAGKVGSATLPGVDKGCRDGDDASTAILINGSESEAEHDFDISPGETGFVSPSTKDRFKRELLIEGPISSQSPVSAASTDFDDAPCIRVMSPIPHDLCSGDGDGLESTVSSSGPEFELGRFSTPSIPQSCLGQEEIGVESANGVKGEPSVRQGARSFSLSSPPKETEEVDVRKDRARQWASNALPISPVGSASSYSESVERSRLQESSQGGSLADTKAAKVAASRERARIFAKQKLGIDSPDQSEDMEDTSMDRKDEGFVERERQQQVFFDTKSSGVGESAANSKRGGAEGGSDGSLPASPGGDSLSERWRSPEVSFASPNESCGSYHVVSNVGELDPGAPPSPLMNPTGAITAANYGVGLNAAEWSDSSQNGRRGGKETRPSTSATLENASLPSPFMSPDKMSDASGIWLGRKTGTAGPRSDRSSYETAVSGRKSTEGIASTNLNIDGNGRDASPCVTPDMRQAGIAEVEQKTRPAKGQTNKVAPLGEQPTGQASPPDALPNALASSSIVSPATTVGVCSSHAKLAELGSYTCLRCRCNVGVEAAETSQTLLLNAWDHEKNGELFEAVLDCISAIKLCDDDRELHLTIKRIGTRIGAF